MAKCFKCGKPIKYIHNKKDGAKMQVNAIPIYFVPPNGFEKEEIFINTSGVEVKGCRRSSDGITGYKRHECDC